MEREKVIELLNQEPRINSIELSKITGIPPKTLRDWRSTKIPEWSKHFTVGTLQIDNKALVSALKTNRMSLLELADYFSVPPKDIKEAIMKLKDENIMIDEFDESYQMATTPRTSPPQLIDTTKFKEVEYPIGLVSDTHIGSKYERLDVLNSLYDRFQTYGVKTVYHAGNILDGEAKFNKYDIYVYGVEAQTDNVIEKYPYREGMVTEFVTGDDHEGWYTQREHIDVGKHIERKAKEAGRSDLIYLGYMERDVVYTQDYGQSVLRVAHPGGGSSYALSYTSQKSVESLQGGEKPSILVNGHYHKYDVSYPREVYVVQPGACQDQTPFMRKRKLQSMVGGCVLWIKQNELGIFTSTKHEWMPYFDKKFYVYHWEKPNEKS